MWQHVSPQPRAPAAWHSHAWSQERVCPNPRARPSWRCQASGGPGSEPASLPLPFRPMGVEHACPLMASCGAPRSARVHPLGRRCGEGDAVRMEPQGGAPGSSVLISDSCSSVFWLQNSCHQQQRRERPEHPAHLTPRLCCPRPSRAPEKKLHLHTETAENQGLSSSSILRS